MAAKEPAFVCSSPFKFGFFAGLGFFFASALMTSLATGLFVLIFFTCAGGFSAGILSNMHTAAAEHHQSKTTVAATDSQ